MQVDDSLIARTQTFLNVENSKPMSSRSKPRITVDDKPFSFYAREITCHRNEQISIRQKPKIKAVTMPITEREFNSKQALLRRINVNWRPGIGTPVQVTAPRTETIAK